MAGSITEKTNEIQICEANCAAITYLIIASSVLVASLF